MLIKTHDKYFHENDGIGISLIDLAKECSYLFVGKCEIMWSVAVIGYTL